MYEGYTTTFNDISPVAMLVMSILPLLIMLAVGVFFCVVWGKLFKKAGLPWERIFVPFYGSYWQCKMVRSCWIFWVALVLGVLNYVFFCATLMASIEAPNELANGFYSLYLTLLMFAMFVLNCIYCFCLAKAFGKGWGFAFGLILLPVIFLPILSFGKAKYQYSWLVSK